MFAVPLCCSLAQPMFQLEMVFDEKKMASPLNEKCSGKIAVWIDV